MNDQAAPTMHSEEAQSDNEIRYFLVWSEKIGEEPAGYNPLEFSCINISVPSTHLLNQDTNPCTAAFKSRNLEANFTCHYHHSTNVFSDFTLVEGTAKGGMEAIKSITISFHRELDGKKVQVADDSGNLFMFIQMEYGYEGDVPISGDIWGKKALTGSLARHATTLSEQEREDLELDRWDEEQRKAHHALLAERKRKAEEQAEQERGDARPSEWGRKAWEPVEEEGGIWDLESTDPIQDQGDKW